MQQMNQEGMDMEMANASMSAGKKEGKGMMMGMVACAVLAIAGIGFGIYEMLQASSAKQQISDLKVEIKKDDGTTTTLETDKIEVKEEDKTIIISDSAITVGAEDYIYIGEWGIKIKIPDNLKGVNYVKNGLNLYIGARLTSDQTVAEYGDDFADAYYNSAGVGAISIYNNPDKCALGEIDVEGDPGSGVRCPIVLENSAGKEIGIRYGHPQTVFSKSDEQRTLEMETINAVEKWLQDASFYSAI